MKNIFIMSSLKDTIIKFWYIHRLTIFIVVFVIIAICIIWDYLYRKSYERIYCKAFTDRGNPSKGEKPVFLPRIEVRRFKKNNKYIYHDPNGPWYPLSKLKIEQIESFIHRNEIPIIDLPKRRKIV